MTVLYVKGVPFVNGGYAKGVSFLPKMVYKKVRGRTSGRSLPVLNLFFSNPRAIFTNFRFDSNELANQ